MRHHLLVVCAAGATLVAAIAVLPQAAARGTPLADVPRQSAPSPCSVTHTMTASPQLLLLGEGITVTLGVQASCPDTPGPMHIVLVLDGSRTMAGQKTQQMKQAATRLIRGMDMSSHPTTKVGVVEFNLEARALCSPTNDEIQAIGCVNRVGSSGSTRIDLGILEGRRVLNSSRGGLHPVELTEVMVVLFDGIDDWACASAVPAAGQARGQGILLIAVCVGDDCDEQCMRQAASDPRYYYTVPDPSDLTAAFEAILQQLLQEVARRLSITYTWGDRHTFVEDSANPQQSEPALPEGWLRWREDWVAVRATGATHRMRLQPLQAGTQLVGEEALGEFIDQRGRTLSWQFDLPRITVLDPSAPPTATTMPTPSVTPIPTTTATSTPKPAPLYLPNCKRHG